MISQQSLEDFLHTVGKVVVEWLLGVIAAILIYLTKIFIYSIQCET